MSEEGGTITVTVRCSPLPDGEEIIELPSTATVLQLKEHFVEKYGLEEMKIVVRLTKGQRLLRKDDQVLSTLSSDSKSVKVDLMEERTASHQMEGIERFYLFGGSD
jgi:hypothetical protein